MTLRELRNVCRNDTQCDVTAIAYERETGKYFSFRTVVCGTSIRDDDAFPSDILDEEVIGICTWEDSESGKPILAIDIREFV